MFVAWKKPNQYEFGLINRKVIFFPFQNSYPYAPLIEEIDIKNCLNCRICERACMNNAIDLTQKPEVIKIKVGVKVIAIGADLYSDLNDYHYDPQNNIITSAEFERMLSSDGPTEGIILKLSDKRPPKTISIIQDIGPSRQLSELTDIIALKYLNCIKVKNPECKVNVFYNLENLQHKYEPLMKSTNERFHYVNQLEIRKNEKGNIVVADSKEYPSDLIILNVDLIPNKDLKSLRKTLDFSLNDEGFMSKETLASGIFGVGTILGPFNYQSTRNISSNVALKIISLLSNDFLISEFTGVEIDEEKCGLCSLCVNACPYNAITIEGEKINIDKFKCKGCGTCVSVCPTNAIEMNIDTNEKIFKTIDIYSKYNFSPKILVFCCQSCGYAAADDAGLKKQFYNPNIFILKVPCTGRVDANFIIRAFEKGFQGVMIIGCRKDACRYIDGIQKVQKKVHLLKKVLGPKLSRKIIIKNLNAVEGSKFSSLSNKFYNILEEEFKFET